MHFCSVVDLGNPLNQSHPNCWNLYPYYCHQILCYHENLSHLLCPYHRNLWPLLSYHPSNFSPRSHSDYYGAQDHECISCRLVLGTPLHFWPSIHAFHVETSRVSRLKNLRLAVLSFGKLSQKRKWLPLLPKLWQKLWITSSLRRIIRWLYLASNSGTPQLSYAH